MWLGYMASHKYFNYTGLINTTPLCEVKTSCAKSTLVLATYSVALLHSAS